MMPSAFMLSVHGLSFEELWARPKLLESCEKAPAHACYKHSSQGCGLLFQGRIKQTNSSMIHHDSQECGSLFQGYVKVGLFIASRLRIHNDPLGSSPLKSRFPVHGSREQAVKEAVGSEEGMGLMPKQAGLFFGGLQTHTRRRCINHRIF